MKFRQLSAVLFALALVLAACGGSGEGEAGDDGTTAPTSDGTTGDDGPDATEPPDAPDTTAPEGNGGGGGEVTEMGSFTVNGTVFPVTLLNRCAPFGDGPDDLSLQGLSQGVAAKINLDKGSFVDASVDGSLIQEQFGSIAFASDFEAGVESEVSGDRWTGSATLFDALDTVDPVDVTWDLMIPTEINDCGL